MFAENVTLPMGNKTVVAETWLPETFPPSSGPAVLVALLAATLFFLSRKPSTNSDFPLINPRKFYDIGGIRAKLSFVFNARHLLALGVRTQRPFRLLTDIGELTVLPAHYANEIRNDPRLSFAEVISQTFHADLPGFEGFRQGTADAHMSRDVANKQLTHSLGRSFAPAQCLFFPPCQSNPTIPPASVTEALSGECAAALDELFPASEEEWTDVSLRDRVLQLVARLSSRVFLGEAGARNAAWQRITAEYTKTAYVAAYVLRLWPARLRPLVHWALPPCRRLRAQVAEARGIVVDMIEARRSSRDSGGQQYNDAVAWFEQDRQRGSDYDPVVAQLILAQAAIETTTDLLTQALLDLAAHPELAGPLREEVAAVVGKAGWKKSSVYEMKLVDSVLKESQRLKPLAMTSMHRLVLEDVTLSDGVRLAKGTVIGVAGSRMWDADVHEDPARFDGYRFLRMRGDDGRQHQAHFVSTSADHLAFGHGRHACAGRFFVAHEAKIALSHLLLKYDWKVADRSPDPKPFEFGLTLVANPKAVVSIRARKAEMEL
ncbi:Ent-kaurene oxidase [Diplodia seriata]|uniref:Ent-kaurene oxidase n=1 Tax=Diplodia seriata TaxID=420778 RepID=A0A1S8BP88_9PEZI|nr:Ent-kaurene oxidase [Diplodia seriata]